MSVRFAEMRCRKQASKQAASLPLFCYPKPHVPVMQCGNNDENKPLCSERIRKEINDAAADDNGKEEMHKGSMNASMGISPRPFRVIVYLA